MQPEQQQRIMGYFIEEAKDHLNTIERGLLNLQSTIEDAEQANEVFRAAHSVKGGAAMLGLTSIQQTAHRLEDGFKVLKETPGLQVDGYLESLLFRIFDTLQNLLDQLRGPFGLTEDGAQAAMAEAQPVFEQLEQHLRQLVASVSSVMAVAGTAHGSRATTVPTALPSTSPRQIFHDAVTDDLHELLHCFKQAHDLPDARQQLQSLCDRLKSHGELCALVPWVQLVETIKAAIAIPKNSYPTLARLVIPDLKQAQDLIRAGREAEVAASPQLQALLSVPERRRVPSASHGTEHRDALELDLTLLGTNSADDGAGLEDRIAMSPIELNTLADLFEQELPDLSSNWQEETIVPATSADAIDPLLSVSDFSPGAHSDWLEHEESERFAGNGLDLDDWNWEEAADLQQAGFRLIEEDSEDTPFDRPALEDRAELGELELAADAPWEQSLDLDTELESDQAGDLDLGFLDLDLDASEWSGAMEAESETVLEFDAGLQPPVAASDAAVEALDRFEFDRDLELDHPIASDLELDRDLELGSDIKPDRPIDHAIEVDSDLDHDLDVVTISETAIRQLEPLVDLFDDAALPESAAQKPHDEESAGDTVAHDADSLDWEGLSLAEPLPSDPPTYFGPPPAESDLFGDLDDLLAEEGLSADSSHSEPAGRDDFADLDELLATVEDDQALAGADNFTELEALLATEESEQPPDSTSLEQAEDVEFGDLEKLLEESKKNMGGLSGAAGLAASASGRRQPRSGQRLTDQTMRVPIKHLDNLSNLVGELVVNRNSLEQDQERLRQFLDNLLYQVQQLGDVGQRLKDLYERSLLENSLLTSRNRRLQGHPEPSSHADIPAEQGFEYDPLEMDRFTGFHTLSQEMIELIVRVRESASDIGFVVDETEQITRTFRQVTTQLQEGLTRSRMVPFSQTADRLPRAVRDIALKCGKQAELVVEGRDTLIDKMILEHLYDPMTHLVNNAITHGIESPEVRRNLGKPVVGCITIQVFHQGNQTVITVSDDGAGIDVDRIRAKALEKGLMTAAEAQSMSRLDLYDLIFHPGFSTRDQADDFAGRGVGMDVVRTSLTDIRGVIHIDSIPGKGTTFTIRLPLTLSISKALGCISDRSRIAFPMDGVEDMLDLSRDQIVQNTEGQLCIPWRETLLPLRPLTELLSYNRLISRGNIYGGNQEEGMISVVVLRSGGHYLALQVDQVLGEQEIVIKQLEGPIPKPLGIAGATVLGDGRIMPIADVLELIDLSQGRIRRDPGSMWEQGAAQVAQAAAETAKEPMVLIVDDSITVRELLSMTFTKAGYRVEQARDGQEAWEKLRAGLPCDIVFCDIEMPRMDGLELLSRLQKDVHFKQLPVAMLTSRGADRHQQMAASLGARGYFTKPYLEESLLDAAARMLQGEVLIAQP
jgi:chemosensory pili system protein ChpA (sensor histidine kinase/response regulator)